VGIKSLIALGVFYILGLGTLPLSTRFSELPLGKRVEATVKLVQRRGYALPLKTLSEWLMGGVEPEERVYEAVLGHEDLAISSGLVHSLNFAPERLAKSLQRQALHHEHQQQYWTEVERYVRALVQSTPQIRAVCLAGSMSAGGFVHSDDVDFNLFVAPGTRYTSYLQANLQALGFSLRHRHRPTDAHTQRPLLPKLMSVNVIWTADQVRPFARHDSAMALEIFLSKPLWGESYFRDILGHNLWLKAYFPQLFASKPSKSVVAIPLLRNASLPPHPLLEKASRWLTYRAWRWVMWTRRNNPEALARVAHIRRCQSPYGLFQEKALSANTLRVNGLKKKVWAAPSQQIILPGRVNVRSKGHDAQNGDYQSM
jgi:hypothetical protein